MKDLTPQPERFRTNDLIAKIAHVRIKDTLRVLLALQAVAERYEVPVEHLLLQPRSAERPTPEQVEECDRAYGQIREGRRAQPYLNELGKYV